MMTLGQAHALLPDSKLVGSPDVEVQRVHTDTRTVQRGDLFVALRGERFDGHDFLAAARAAGASAALAEQGLAEAGLPGLRVADTQASLGALAAAWRHRFELPLIAVTGSNGKTTVTQMIASILRAWLGAGALATAGNLNNHIGVPLTVLRLRCDDAAYHRAAVVELGMNHAGEIAELARIAQPTIALVNNAQREHQEFMAGIDAVARENGAVLSALPASGIAVFPADDPHAPLWRALAGVRRTITFGVGGEVTAEAQWQGDRWSLALKTPAGPVDTTLAMAGEHNVRNALAATACALAAGCPLTAIAEGLAAFVAVKGRSQVQRLPDGTTLIDDSYNANPDSVRAAIDLLATLPAPRWLILGDMGEVGDQGPAFHAEVGAHAKARGIESLWLAGEATAHTAAAFGSAARRFGDAAELAAALAGRPAARSILVKGSRFMRMERVVAALAAGGAHAD
jgi:UDP-N-acetylmuramoyl-tripeptide--D-alanyl-D-alanine ligase